MDRQTLSDLVAAIYDGAVDAAVWPDALRLICDALGFRKATIDLNRVPAMTNVFNAHHGIDDHQAATMVSHYRAMPEVWGGLAATLTRPIDRPWVVSRILSQEALRETTYYRDWVGPMGLVDGAAIVLARDGGLFGSIRLATDACLGIIDDALVEALTLLLPHCQRAARISGLLDRAQGAARDFQAVIDAMAVPILLVAADASLVHANDRARALLDRRVLLEQRDGRLAALVPTLRPAIGEAIRRCTEDEAALSGSGVGLPVRALDGSACTLHLLPLGRGALRRGLAGDAVAAIFVSGERGCGLDLLRALFDLTPAELAVLERIVAGGDTRRIAADLGVATSTVKTHVLRLFQKTEVNSRADLVRLALALEAPVAR